MARKGQYTFSKRQRERKKAEKAAEKRSRRALRKEDAPDEATETEAGEDSAAPEDDVPASE